MSARDLYNWIVGGYRAGGASKHTTFWNGYAIDHGTRRGRLTYWLLMLDDALNRQPSRLRWWVGDQFALAALRVRGDRTRVYGFYDCERGNRAAELVENLRLDLIGRVPDDELNEILEKLGELGTHARALWIRNDGDKNQLELMPHPIPANILTAAHEVAYWMTANGYGRGWKLGPIQDREPEGEQ